MRVGQIYRSAKSGNKARIILIDRENDDIKIEWFESDGELCLKDVSTFDLSHIEQLVKEGVIEIYDEMPTENPNFLFKKENNS
jgi:hypothetical protein